MQPSPAIFPGLMLKKSNCFVTITKQLNLGHGMKHFMFFMQADPIFSCLPAESYLTHIYNLIKYG